MFNAPVICNHECDLIYVVEQIMQWHLNGKMDALEFYTMGNHHENMSV